MSEVESRHEIGTFKELNAWRGVAALRLCFAEHTSMVRDKKDAATAISLDCMTRVGSRMWFGRYFTFIASDGTDVFARWFETVCICEITRKKLRSHYPPLRDAFHSSIRRFFCSRDGLSEEVYHLGVHYLARSNYRHVTADSSVRPRRKRREQ